MSTEKNNNSNHINHIASLDKQDKISQVSEQAKRAKQAYQNFNSALANQSSNNNIKNNLKDNILASIINNLLSNQEKIIENNQLDLDAAKNNNLPNSMIDRLTVDTKTIQSMANSVKKIIHLPDPCNQELEEIKHENGMIIKKISCPIGLIAIIYESRPNVTLDAAALCIKSGNAVILKGGKEAINTNRIIADTIKQSLIDNSIVPNLVEFIDSTDRGDTLALLQQDEVIDLVIPRGGRSLIEFIHNNTRIPVLKHLDGICHTYIDCNADLNMASKIIINAKCQRPGVCNAMETLLVHNDIANDLFKILLPEFAKNNLELRVCPRTKLIIANLTRSHSGLINQDNIKIATQKDWVTEYLDLILSIKIVDDIDQAIEHINQFGSHHSDCIVTNDTMNAEYFMQNVDSATVYHNSSTRFTDGEVFGMGGEMGISTDKLHARGPVGLNELTIYKYKIYGSGQIRQ